MSSEFKQEQFAFVDIVSLIFLVILFIGNFFGIIYLSGGNLPISVVISALIIVFYYAIIQVLKKKKQVMVSKKYKTAQVAYFFIFIVFGAISAVFLTHFINIESNVKPKVQQEVNEKLGKVESINTLYEERAKANLQNFEGELSNKLRDYLKNHRTETKDSLAVYPYNIDNQTLETISASDIENTTKYRLSSFRKTVQNDLDELNSIVEEAKTRKKDFEKWNRLNVATDYNTLNKFIKDSYDVLNSKLEKLPFVEEKVVLELNEQQLPLNSFTALNKLFPPSWGLPIIAVVIIHLFILIPFFLYKVRKYVGDENDEVDGVKTY